jgi:hypothetical protein
MRIIPCLVVATTLFLVNCGIPTPPAGVPGRSLQAEPNGRIFTRIHHQSGNSTFELRGGDFIETDSPFPEAPPNKIGLSGPFELPSPDNRFTALCFNLAGQHPGVIYHFSLLELPARKELSTFNLKPQFIADLAWSPGSGFIAVLEERERWGVNPLALLAAFSGHPIPHSRFLVVVLDTKGSVLASYPIPGSYKYASGGLVWAR